MLNFIQFYIMMEADKSKTNISKSQQIKSKMFAQLDTTRCKTESRSRQQSRHKLKDDVGIFPFDMLQQYNNNVLLRQ